MRDARVARFFQSMQERCTTISTELVFFALELNRLDDAVLQEKLAAPELARYATWLRDLRAMRPPQLSEDRKSVVQGKRVTVRVDLGGRRIIQKTKKQTVTKETQ